MLMLAMVGGVEVQSILFLPGDPWDSYINCASFPQTSACYKSSSFLSQIKGFPHGGGIPNLQPLARSNPEDLLYCDLTASFTKEEGRKIFGGPPHYLFLVYHNF